MLESHAGDGSNNVLEKRERAQYLKKRQRDKATRLGKIYRRMNQPITLKEIAGDIGKLSSLYLEAEFLELMGIIKRHGDLQWVRADYAEIEGEIRRFESMYNQRATPENLAGPLNKDPADQEYRKQFFEARSRVKFEPRGIDFGLKPYPSGK